MFILSYWCWFAIPVTITGWNLATVDDSGLNFVTNNNDFAVVHVSVFYVRSFLSIRNRWNTTNSKFKLNKKLKVFAKQESVFLLLLFN